MCHITHKKKFAKFLEHLATALGLVSSLFMCYFSLLAKWFVYAGTCVDLVNNYTCQCNVGFRGQHCGSVIRNCSSDACFPGVRCIQITNTITCDPCPTGYFGDGKNCKGISDLSTHWLILVTTLRLRLKNRIRNQGSMTNLSTDFLRTHLSVKESLQICFGYFHKNNNIFQLNENLNSKL